MAQFLTFGGKSTRPFSGTFWGQNDQVPESSAKLLEKLWAYLCELVESIWSSQAPFGYLLFVLFLIFHSFFKILRVKMSLLTEGSRESLSSLFDLVFCSWALIWCQWAQAKSSVWLLKVLNFIEKCPGHFTATFMHFSFPDKPKPMLKEPWAFQGLFMSSDRSFELVGSFPGSSSWYGLEI